MWDVRRVSRRVGEVRVPKAGWVRFRWSRPVPPGVKSYRVTMHRPPLASRLRGNPGAPDRSWHGQIVGVDRGVAVSAALSTGELLRVPHPVHTSTSEYCACSGGSPVLNAARIAAEGYG